MKSRHAAALALVGWYLMVPPWTAPDTFDSKAPISKWQVFLSFDSAQQCQDAQIDYHAKWRRNAFQRNERVVAYNVRLFGEAQCIATDDPRLK